MLQIEDLHVKIDETEILQGLNLSIKPGEIHAIMGPNGSGKSTLSKTIAGHPSYEITQGKIMYNNEELNELEPDQRSHLGVFLGFQYPLEIPGVSNEDFLRLAYNSKLKSEGKEEIDPLQFLQFLIEKMNLINKKKMKRN